MRSWQGISFHFSTYRQNTVLDLFSIILQDFILAACTSFPEGASWFVSFGSVPLMRHMKPSWGTISPPMWVPVSPNCVCFRPSFLRAATFQPVCCWVCPATGAPSPPRCHFASTF